MILKHSLLDRIAEKTTEAVRLLDARHDDDDDRHVHTRQAIEQLVECIRILALKIEDAPLPSYSLGSEAGWKAICDDRY